MIITDTGTLVHALRQAGELVGAHAAPYSPDRQAANKLLGRLHGWPAGTLPEGVRVKVSLDANELNLVLDKWRIVGPPINQSGYRFGAMERQIGIVTSLYWWLVPTEPGLWIAPGLPQIVMMPTRRLGIYEVEGWQAPVVRIPTRHHGDLWLTHSDRLSGVIQIAQDALRILQAPRREWQAVYHHLALPVFFGYQDAPLAWLRDTYLRVPGAEPYGLGPIVQQVRTGINLHGVRRSGQKVDPGKCLSLSEDLLGFITPPSDPGTPYAVLGIRRHDDWAPLW